MDDGGKEQQLQTNTDVNQQSDDGYNSALEESDQMYEYQYQSENAGLLADAAVLSSLSQSTNSLGYEEEFHSTATLSSSSNSTGCKRDSDEAGMVSYSTPAAQSDRRNVSAVDDDGVIPDHKRGGANGRINNNNHTTTSRRAPQHHNDMHSLTTSLTGMSTTTPNVYCPPRRVVAPPLDLFVPTNGRAATSAGPAAMVPTANKVVVGKPSVPVASKKQQQAAAVSLKEGKQRVIANNTNATKGKGAAKDDTVDQQRGVTEGGGGLSMLQSTMRSIKSQNLLPKPVGSTTVVKMTTIVDDADNEVSEYVLCLFAMRWREWTMASNHNNILLCLCSFLPLIPVI